MQSQKKSEHDRLLSMVLSFYSESEELQKQWYSKFLFLMCVRVWVCVALFYFLKKSIVLEKQHPAKYLITENIAESSLVNFYLRRRCGASSSIQGLLNVFSCNSAYFLGGVSLSALC